MKYFSRFVGVLAIAVSTLVVTMPIRGQNPPTSKAETSSKESSSKPSAQEIAGARSKGQVWVNLGTKVYHKLVLKCGGLLFDPDKTSLTRASWSIIAPTFRVHPGRQNAFGS